MALEPAKAQGTIEYLVILAVIIVIGLVVVSMASNFIFSPSQQIGSSAQAISAISGPIGFLEVVADGNGNMLMSVQNNTGSTQTLERISLRGRDGEELSGNDYNFEGLATGSGYVFAYSGEGCECAPGQATRTCTIMVTTTNEYGIERTYSVEAPISCSSSVDLGGSQSYIPPAGGIGGGNTPPEVLLLSPSPGQTIETIDFVFSVNDDSGVSYCEFVVGGSVVDSMSSPAMETPLTFRLPDGTTTGGPSSPDNNSWTVRCSDGTNTAAPSALAFTNAYSAINYVSECGTLSGQYSYKHLTRDVNTMYGNCFTIADNNITFGGAGHRVFSENTYGASKAFNGSNVSGPGKTGSVFLDLSIASYADAAIDVSGGPSGLDGNDGGTVMIKRSSIVGSIISAANATVTRNAGNGGNITIIDSNVSGAQAWGGTAMAYSSPGVVRAGRGGDINVVNSKVDYIWTYGYTASCPSGCPGSSVYGGSAGNVTLTNSTTTQIWAYGASATCGGSCGVVLSGNGGNVVFNPCPSPVPSVNVNRGGFNGTVGTITPSDCHT